MENPVYETENGVSQEFQYEYITRAEISDSAINHPQGG